MKTGFLSISVDEFVKATININPKEDLKGLRQSVLDALKDYKDGTTCDCGNPIWVAGSAIAGNGCFTCITGEAAPDEDFEIDEAL